MKMYDLISKKKHGEAMTEEEIRFLVNGFTNGSIEDYQMSAFLMAVCLKGMNLTETVALTMAMANSGDVLDLSAIPGKKADKHSTGGVGDKTSLILGPMVAALGVPVAKMSGRGLGHTGGTIDKLESFPGFDVNLSEERFISQVREHGLAITGQTANLAPADKKLYALRDVTATVDNMSLIASSIMSKKIAAGADVIVLDVKVGSGAFMQTEEEATELAKLMVQIGCGVRRTTYAVLSDMNQPLGNAIGNSLEVIEAIDTLKGNGPEDLLEASLTLASFMLLGAGRAKDEDEARTLLLETIKNGSALKKFAEFVEAQGGDTSYVYDTDKFPKASIVCEIPAWETGYVTAFRVDEIGMVSQMLGGGREKKTDVIDPSVGLKLIKKLGDPVTEGEPITVLYANDETKLAAAKERFCAACTIGQEKPVVPNHIYGVIGEET